MLDNDQIVDDFINRGFSPHELHKKYNVTILYIYDVLEHRASEIKLALNKKFGENDDES